MPYSISVMEKLSPSFCGTSLSTSGMSQLLM